MVFKQPYNFSFRFKKEALARYCSNVLRSHKLIISSFRLVYKYTVQCFSILYFTFDNGLEIHVRTEILCLFILCQFLAYTYILS